MIKKHKLSNNLKSLIGCLKYEYSRGMTLFEIHQTVKKSHGRDNTAIIFYNFVKINKKNQSFMEEFNTTVFDLK